MAKPAADKPVGRLAGVFAEWLFGLTESAQDDRREAPRECCAVLAANFAAAGKPAEPLVCPWLVAPFGSQLALGGKQEVPRRKALLPLAAVSKPVDAARQA
jgi:hypothetical protein